MKNKSIPIIMVMLLLLGIFFQNNRTEGFLHLLKNTEQINRFEKIKTATNIPVIAGKEEYILLYDKDDNSSLELIENITKTLGYIKKNVTLIEINQTLSNRLFEGKHIIVAFENLDKLNLDAIKEIFDATYKGSNFYLMMRPLQGNVFTENLSKLGIQSSNNIIKASEVGVILKSNVLVGQKNTSFKGEWFSNSCLDLQVTDSANIHLTSSSGLPLLWESQHGKGSIVFYNGTNLHEKNNRGLIVGILSLGRDFFLYPVAGIKTVHLDDFPSPIPQGIDEKIFQDYGMNISDFYREIWWSEMVKLGKNYNVKYTGLIIESYNEKVYPPFLENDYNTRNKLIIFGSELLKQGGELGLHGYNHQSLAPKGYIIQDLGYSPWDSQENMELALKEALRYIDSTFPSYKLKVYVPPSNILSPMGRRAVRAALPDVEIIASLYDKDYSTAVYSQEFEQSADGVLEFPRISYDYLKTEAEDWAIYNSITSLGIFSHFIHPDDVLDPNRNQGKRWQEMYEEFSSLLKLIHNKYGWLRAGTLSEAGSLLKNYLNSNYYFSSEEGSLNLYTETFRGEIFYILKTDHKVVSFKGCLVDIIDENTYLLKVKEPEANLLLKGEEK